ncbi:probable G-protein coupled receptor No18 [Ctenocephalides felis]|uniref:probable G-protein coupled receptor No18 n=1 Tax=Ctenocephalides felis TaxID=7515 RepID=UPI000E6E4781|nr:probable G-protein coupled receptor No18 [Ctenocephalides felis]
MTTQPEALLQQFEPTSTIFLEVSNDILVYSEQIIDTNFEMLEKSYKYINDTVTEASSIVVLGSGRSFLDTKRFLDEQHTWQELVLIVLLCFIIVITVIGNTLIITSVLTTRRLRTVTNCFVTSLAVADWLVGIFVMPPAVALHWVGTWQLGWVLCDVWISLDVLLCTASILSLCAISIDRYLAVTQPLNYSRRRRSKRLALMMILAVWILALAITCPPILGWYEPGRHQALDCRYNRNRGYVIFSAMGSFFLPLLVVLYVYARISCVVARRHDRLGEMRDSKNQRHKSSNKSEREIEESEADGGTCTPMTRKFKSLANLTTTNDKNNQFNLKPTCECQLMSNKLMQMDNVQMVPLSLHQSTSPPLHNTTKPLRQRISSLKRETKTAQTLSIVVGGFVACWLPFFVYYLLTPFLPQDKVSDMLMSFLTWLGWINSAINPFIYAFYNVDFRAAFWRLTLARCFKKR